MDRRGMFGSRKSPSEDSPRGEEAAEVRATRAEARAELAEKRLRDADELASIQITAASQTLMEVREVVAVLREQLETMTGQLAGITTRFEDAVDQGSAVQEESATLAARDEPAERPEPADSAHGSGREDRPDGDGAQSHVGGPERGSERSAGGMPTPGGSPLQRATRMAMAGKSRERIAQTLSREFGVEDPTPILDEAMGQLDD